MWCTSCFQCVLADLQLLCSPNAHVRWDARDGFGHHNCAHQGHSASVYGDCNERSQYTRKSCCKIRNEVPKWCWMQNWTRRTKVYFKYAFICFICCICRIHYSLVPVTPYSARVFKHLRTKSKLPPRARAMDMRHVLLNRSDPSISPGRTPRRGG